MAKLLGRSLSSTEESNFEQYKDYTISTLTNLLCWSPVCSNTTAKYKARQGYHTLWTDPFTSISEVKVNGSAVTDYTMAFNGNYNYPFYNSLEFPYPLSGQTVEITGTFGFVDLPADLGSLIAEIFKMYGRVNQANNSGNVKSKSVEDFSITYGDDTEMSALISAFSGIIAKYSNCDTGEILHGETGCGNCI